MNNSSASVAHHHFDCLCWCLLFGGNFQAKATPKMRTFFSFSPFAHRMISAAKIAVVLSALACTLAQPTSKPNFVLLYVDDLG